MVLSSGWKPLLKTTCVGSSLFEGTLQFKVSLSKSVIHSIKPYLQLPFMHLFSQHCVAFLQSLSRIVQILLNHDHLFRNAMLCGKRMHQLTVSVNASLHFHETNNTKSLIYLHLSLLFCFSCNCGVCFNVHYSYALAVDKRLLLLLLLLLLSFHDHYNKNMFL